MPPTARGVAAPTGGGGGASPATGTGVQVNEAPGDAAATAGGAVSALADRPTPHPTGVSKDAGTPPAGKEMGHKCGGSAGGGESRREVVPGASGGRG